jgi:CRP-like cAMP-binding protein
VQTLIRRQTPAVDRLKSIDQFRGYKKAQLREVARLAEQVKVGEGEILVREGQFGNEFFRILSGTAEVTQKGRLVNALGPGDFFGELAALNRGLRNATVTALCDLDLLVIGRRELSAMLEISVFRDALLKWMASQMQTIDSQLTTALDEQGILDPNSYHSPDRNVLASAPRQRDSLDLQSHPSG